MGGGGNSLRSCLVFESARLRADRRVGRQEGGLKNITAHALLKVGDVAGSRCDAGGDARWEDRNISSKVQSADGWVVGERGKLGV